MTARATIFESGYGPIFRFFFAADFWNLCIPPATMISIWNFVLLYWYRRDSSVSPIVVGEWKTRWYYIRMLTLEQSLNEWWQNIGFERQPFVNKEAEKPVLVVGKFLPRLMASWSIVAVRVERNASTAWRLSQDLRCWHPLLTGRSCTTKRLLLEWMSSSRYPRKRRMLWHNLQI